MYKLLHNLSKVVVAALFILPAASIVQGNLALAETPADFQDIQNQQTNTSSQPTVTDKKVQQELRKNPIVKDLNTIVNFLSAGVGVVVVIVIIIGGIQYSMAGDNPQAVSAARQRIMNGLIALLAFLFMFAFLQWLIPGGVFNKP